MGVTDLETKTAPKIERGRIYREVYGRRTDDRPVTQSAQLCKAHIADDALSFGSNDVFAQALEDGVFQLAIPDDMQEAMVVADQFSREFFGGKDFGRYGLYREKDAKLFKDPLLGFHTRSNQIEQFLLERRFWQEHYPLEIAKLGEALTDVSRVVLRDVFDFIGLPEALWSKASGGCIDKVGSYHLTFNHYRPIVEGVGLASHKDDGFLTILRTTAGGLEVNRAGRWERVMPDQDHFVINFGLSMEFLTQDCARPVAAILHRVAHQECDRSSFGHFTSSACEPGRTVSLYRYIAGALHNVCSARELIDVNDHEIYAGTDRPEGEVQ